MRHSIDWFFTSGLYDPAWVQAVALATLLLVAFLTFLILVLYLRKAHALAQATFEQLRDSEISLRLLQQQHDELLRERAVLAMRNFHFAYAAFLRVQGRLRSLGDSLAERSFGTFREPVLWQPDWPDVASAFYARVPGADRPATALGAALQDIDAEIDAFFKATTREHKLEREARVQTALNRAREEALKLNGMLTSSREAA